MAHLELPRFPRGFLLAERHVEAPPTFVPGPLLNNFYVHPWTNLQVAGNQTLFVIVLGHCVPIRNEQSENAADELLEALRRGEGEFLRALDHYSGRHAIIFGSSGNIRVVNDATAMRSVFYASEGGIVASHAQLVEYALGGDMQRSEVPFRYGYPGNRTPYRRTKILTANTYYWMTAHLVRRFWPVISPEPRTVEQVATDLLTSSALALQRMSRNRTVRLSLTAGLDSRAVLAIALYAGIPFETYTYGDDRSTKTDRLVARELAERYGLVHTPVENKVKNELLRERLTDSHYAFHHVRWVGALREYFTDVTDLAVIGNLLEIGRSNYAPARSNGAAPPVDAESMSALHFRKVGDAVARRIREFGHESFRTESENAFHGFIKETGYENVAGLLDPFDHFYWEHRMSTWQGVAMGERDFYAEPFVPFNARSIFESMLGAPFASRRRDEAVLRLIHKVDPELLHVPVNPRRWPPRSSPK